MYRLTALLTICFMFSQAWTEPVPFDPDRGLVEVEVTIDGIARGEFGIDTGADRLYLDSDFARANNLKVSPLRAGTYVAGIGGISKTSEVSIRSLRIGRDETLYNLTATVADLEKLGGSTSGEHPDGLIGFEILRRFYVTVDYPNGTMELISHEPDFLGGQTGYVSIPFEQRRHMIMVNTIFGDTVMAPMIFDYCASLTTVSPELAERLGFDSDGPERITIGDMGFGKVGSTAVAALIIDHGNLTQSNPGVEFEGIIGASFFYRSKITVDYKRQLIYFH
jgi:predicted aspartyl protease